MSGDPHFLHVASLCPDHLLEIKTKFDALLSQYPPTLNPVSIHSFGLSCLYQIIKISCPNSLDECFLQPLARMQMCFLHCLLKLTSRTVHSNPHGVPSIVNCDAYPDRSCSAVLLHTISEKELRLKFVARLLRMRKMLNSQCDQLGRDFLSFHKVLLCCCKKMIRNLVAARIKQLCFHAHNIQGFVTSALSCLAKGATAGFGAFSKNTAGHLFVASCHSSFLSRC